MKIEAAKQVHNLSYMTSSVDVLYKILREGQITSSTRVETHNGRKERFVSFSRHLIAAAKRNNSRWKYGIIVDGTKLSNRYRIQPYSFTGTQLIAGNKLTVKSVARYDDGSCSLSLVNRPTIEISNKIYDNVVQLICSQDASFNASHRLEKLGPGSRSYRGRTRVEGYNYNVKHGGVKLNNSNTYGALASMLATHNQIDESEERIWMGDRAICNISGCIKGIILPAADIDAFDSSESPEWVRLRKIVNTMNLQSSILYY